MDVSEIVDRGSFEAWLEELPEERRYEWAVTLATRAALRVFPVWAARMPQDWAVERHLTLVPSLRNMLLSTLASKLKIVDFREVAAVVEANSSNGLSVLLAGASVGSIMPYGASVAAVGAAAAENAKYSYSLASEVFFGENSAVASFIAAASLAVERSADTVSWEALQSDCSALLNGDGIFQLPLWSQYLQPKQIKMEWIVGRAWMEAAPGHAFWIRWYEAILAGRPLTGDWDSHWQLMHDIALIDPEDWGEGKEQDAIRVAGIIDLITQKHALQQEVARAKKALENETFDAMTLGRHRDNLPDDIPPSQIVEYRAALAELQTELDAVELALQPPVPDAEALEEATGRLRAVWEKIKKYPVAFAFVTLIGAAATGAAGQAGVRGMDWFFDQGMPQLIRGLKDVAPKPSAAAKPQHNWEKPSVDL